MDPLHFCIAVVPLAVYLLMVALVNMRRHPFVTTGARDFAALGIGVAGFIMAGPMELFFPEGAASQFGGWVWPMLMVFYGLIISMIVLLMRSRIVIYNVSLEQLRPVLTSVAMQMDARSRWVGESLIIPAANIHLHVQTTGGLRNIQLTAIGHQQSQKNWLRLQSELSEKLNQTPVRPGWIAVPLLIASICLAISTAWWMLSDQQAVAQALREMWR